MRTSQLIRTVVVLAIASGGVACQPRDADTARGADSALPAVDTAHRLTPRVAGRGIELPVTLPVLDAFFADSAFVAQLQPRLDLTDAQIDSLRRISSEETARLRRDASAGSGMAWAARELATAKINTVIGIEKSARLMALVRYYWSDVSAGADTTLAGRDSAVLAAAAVLSNVPTDTRVVVNAPAYRMDVFEAGRLVKTYRIGIGYPEFPLPTGMRAASRIIFNPTWTPPNEPWVEGGGTAKVGRTVAAGSKLNPLGIAKIPIGLPSLIHGGKLAKDIGGFASHGCVGLTDVQLRDFALLLARIGGGELTDSAIRAFARRRTVTKEIALPQAIPVELRYETIMVHDGALHVYRDVYDYDTNNEAALAAALALYGVTPAQLTTNERTLIVDALREMSRDVGPVGEVRSKADSGAVTRRVTGRKEVVIPVAVLAGRGYPAPVVQ